MNSLAEGARLLSELQVNLYLLVHNFGKTDSNPKLTLLGFTVFNCSSNIKLSTVNISLLHWKPCHMKLSHVLCPISNYIRIIYLITDNSCLNISVSLHYLLEELSGLLNFPLLGSSHYQHITIKHRNPFKSIHPFYSARRLGGLGFAYMRLWLECPSQPHCLIRKKVSRYVSASVRIPNWQPSTMKETIQSDV